MPSINDAVQKNKERISAGGETNAYAAAPVTNPPQSFVIAPTPPQDLPLGGGLPQRGTLPIETVNPADINDSNRIFRGGTMRSSVYPYPTASPSGTTKINVTEIISGGGSATPVTPGTPSPTPTPVPAGSVLLATNGIPNIDQSELNLDAVAPVGLAAGSTGDVAISVAVMAGDFGSGGATGLVPAPAAGAAAAGKFLKADGTFAVPPGTGSAANYQEVEGAGTPEPVEPILNFLSPLVATDNPGNTSTDISIVIPSQTVSMSGNVSGSAIQATVISAFVTMPSTGGPWRALIHWNVEIQMITNHDVTFWVTDGVTAFRFVHVNGQTSDTTGAGQGFMTPTTYANGASVTFTLLTIGTAGANYTVVAVAPVGTGANSGMDVSIFPS